MISCTECWLYSYNSLSGYGLISLEHIIPHFCVNSPRHNRILMAAKTEVLEKGWGPERFDVSCSIILTPRLWRLIGQPHSRIFLTSIAGLFRLHETWNSTYLLCWLAWGFTLGKFCVGNSPVIESFTLNSMHTERAYNLLLKVMIVELISKVSIWSFSSDHSLCECFQGVENLAQRPV